jgi:hypothetical protein
MIMNKKALTLFFLAVLTVSSIFAKSLKKSDITITRADGSTITCISELAIKPEERNFGFMKRKNIPDGTGMLFIFENEQILSFWMKDTPHPLSIAFIDSRGKIRNIFDMKPYSLSSIQSTVSCRYALEVPQGWFDKNNIKPGDTLSLNF